MLKLGTSIADEIVGAHGAAEFRPTAHAPIVGETSLARKRLEALRLAHRRIRRMPKKSYADARKVAGFAGA